MVYFGGLVVAPPSGWVGIPKGICVSSDSTKAFVALDNSLSGGAGIAVINLTTRVVTALWNTPPWVARYIATGGDYVFMTPSNDNSVEVYDKSSGALVTSLGTSGTPMFVRVDPTDTIACVCCEGGAKLDVVELSLLTLTWSLTLGTTGKGPVDIAFSSDGAFGWVSGKSTSDAWQVALPDPTLDFTYTQTSNLYGIVVNHANTAFYGARPLAGTVVCQGTTSGTILATITVGSTPTSLAITPSGNEVYVLNSGAGTVSVIATASNTVTHTISVGSANAFGYDDLAADPNGLYVYATNGVDGTVSVISTSTHAIVDVIGAGGGSVSGIAVG